MVVSRSNAATVNLRIDDDGLTLSPEQLARAWSPYYQGEKYFTGQATGMGLGLSMVATLVWGAGGGLPHLQSKRWARRGCGIGFAYSRVNAAIGGEPCKGFKVQISASRPGQRPDGLQCLTRQFTARVC
jgi:hypothetical protein